MATLHAKSTNKPTMKDRILETADRLFYLQGIRAIGVDTIAAEIGISKRTLSTTFPSKDALIAAYLERRFVQPRASPDKPPAEQILRRPSMRWSGAFQQRFPRLPVRPARWPGFGAEDSVAQNRDGVQGKPRTSWFRDLLVKLGSVMPSFGDATRGAGRRLRSREDLVRGTIRRWRARPGTSARVLLKRMRGWLCPRKRGAFINTYLFAWADSHRRWRPARLRPS